MRVQIGWVVCVLVSVCGAMEANGQAPCACDCDVNGSGTCTIDDVTAVVPCLGMPAVGACVATDVTCDGWVDEYDVEAALCGFRSGPPEDCCRPDVNVFFTYQGQLSFGGVPVTDVCDFEFTLWTEPTSPPGVMVGPVQTRAAVAVTGGLFTVNLSFGRTAFNGEDRWLETAVVCPTGGVPLAVLVPRQEVTPVPYAIRAATGVGGQDALSVDNEDRVGIGISDPLVMAPGAKLHVLSGSGLGRTPVVVERPDDGTLVSFRVAGGAVGSITVVGGGVAYNAFTGAHWAWTDQAIDRGSLVRMTGVNRRASGRVDREIIYGVEPTATANEPACLGAYLGLQDPAGSNGAGNPHLVAAVGNGELWLVDRGQDVAPGDYLISSDVAGHAMKDDEAQFPVGHIVARAAEAVDWDSVSDTIEARKHLRISVLFESFDRGAGTSLSQLVDRQQNQLDDLQHRLNTLAEIRTARDESCGVGEPGVATATAIGLPALGVIGVLGLATIRRARRGGAE